ncbi:MAG: hypothetical protein AAB116_21105 [Candidatus Poribacteria bacterium]
MSDQMTLQEIEQQATRLSLNEQLKLIVYISEQLSVTPIYSEAKKIKQKRLDTAKELLLEVDDIDDDSQGIFDASADIRRIREERQKQIC